MRLEEIIAKQEYDFLRTEERLGENIMFLCFGGSIAYGLNTPTSDVDLRGVTAPIGRDFFYPKKLRHPNDTGKPELKFNAGFGFEEYELHDGEHDACIYGFDKYFRLVSDCNPNTIELLGCRPEHYAHVSETGEMLIANRKIFLSKKAYDKFSGYSRKQFYRLKAGLMGGDNVTQAERYVHLIDIIERMQKHLEESFPSYSRDMIEFYISDLSNRVLKYDNHKINFCDITFKYVDKDCVEMSTEQVDINMDDVKLKVNIHMDGIDAKDLAGVYGEISAVARSFNEHIGHRNNKKDDYHLDKHASCLIRVQREALDILRDHEIRAYMPEHIPQLKDIRQGKYRNAQGKYTDDFFAMIDATDAEIKKAFETTTLPPEPDKDACTKLYEDIMKIHARKYL